MHRLLYNGACSGATATNLRLALSYWAEGVCLHDFLLRQMKSAASLTCWRNGLPRNHLLVLLGLRTGFRISELLSLNIGDVWDGHTVVREISVSRARLKGGRGPKRASIRSRSVPISEEVRESLRQYLGMRVVQSPLEASEPLLCSSRRLRLSRWQANRVIHEAARKAGLSSQQRLGTHSLRKTFARRIYQSSGKDLMLTRAALGHSSVSITQRYLETDAGELNRIILSLATE
jgi:integrase